MGLRPPGTSGSHGARTDNMPPRASELHIQLPTYAAHMQGRVCLSWGHRSPPTRSSVYMLTGFCPGGGGTRVRANSWSPGRGMGAGALQHQAHLEHWETGLLATAQRAGWEPCPPPQPGREVQALGVGLGGPQSAQHFQLHCTPAGVSVEGMIPLQSQNGRASGRTLDQTPGHIFALLDWQEKEHVGYLC